MPFSLRKNFTVRYIKTMIKSTRKQLQWRIAQWAEIHWWNGYLNDKPVDGYRKNKKAYWHRLLEDLDLSLPRHTRILDVGCGPAGIFTILEDNDVTALDPLIGAYALSLDHFNPRDYPWVTFKEATIEAFSDIPYPLVFCLNAINHVHHWSLALDKLTALTKPGGTMILSSDIHKYPWLKKIFRLFPGDILHPHQHGLAEYVHALQSRGWRIIRKRTLKPGRIFDYWGVIAQKA